MPRYIWFHGVDADHDEAGYRSGQRCVRGRHLLFCYPGSADLIVGSRPDSVAFSCLLLPLCYFQAKRFVRWPTVTSRSPMMTTKMFMSFFDAASGAKCAATRRRARLSKSIRMAPDA